MDENENYAAAQKVSFLKTTQIAWQILKGQYVITFHC